MDTRNNATIWSYSLANIRNAYLSIKQKLPALDLKTLQDELSFCPEGINFVFGISYLDRLFSRSAHVIELLQPNTSVKTKAPLFKLLELAETDRLNYCRVFLNEQQCRIINACFPEISLPKSLCAESKVKQRI